MSTLNERIGAEIFRFEAEGQSIRGVLTEIDTIEINGRPTLRYLLHDPEEKRVFSFLGTVDLNTKIRRSDLGKLMQVRFERTEQLPDSRFIKRFRVFAEQA